MVKLTFIILSEKVKIIIKKLFYITNSIQLSSFHSIRKTSIKNSKFSLKMFLFKEIYFMGLFCLGL